MRHPDERLHELPVHHLGQPQGVDADLLKVVDGGSEPVGAAGPAEPNPDPDLHQSTFTSTFTGPPSQLHPTTAGYRYRKPSRKRRNRPPSRASGGPGSGATGRCVAMGWS